MKSIRRGALLALLLGLPGLIYYALRSQPPTLRILDIADDRFAGMLAGKTIVQLTDIHLSCNSTRAMQRLLHALDRLKPDLIFLTGDYVPWYGEFADYEMVWRFLEQLRAPLGVYAVMGDADYTFPRQSCAFCHRPNSALPPERHRVRFLRDETLTLHINGQPLQIAGLDCGPRMQPQLEKVRNFRFDRPTLFISHTSLAFYPVPDNRPVIVLSGDTHGGLLPMPKWFWQRFKFKPDPEHIYGFFQEGEKMLYVSSGTGNSSARIRIWPPPEMVVIRFIPENLAGDRRVIQKRTRLP
ncbi:MAG: metallophosphoesterase [candidate division KSB1 bacterium]|nr:metallophosphoesterase [candidate division KSB1 bacterium]MDQ7065976.1 metallophosphoesterase [candidate division KSB1 bacterium]